MSYEVSRNTDKKGRVIYEVWQGSGDAYYYFTPKMVEEFFDEPIERINKNLVSDDKVESISIFPKPHIDYSYDQRTLNRWGNKSSELVLYKRKLIGKGPQAHYVIGGKKVSFSDVEYVTTTPDGAHKFYYPKVRGAPANG